MQAFAPMKTRSHRANDPGQYQKKIPGKNIPEPMYDGRSLLENDIFKALPVQKAGRQVHAKSPANTEGEMHDKKAEQVIEQTFGNDTPLLQRKCSCGGTCADCEEEKDREKLLQTSKMDANSQQHTTAPESVHDVLRSTGKPLDNDTRGFMEQRFGYDFSQVRVHTGTKAEESAREVNALAYTVGKDVVFGSGHYAPGTPGGRRLLAHELTHVVQQSPLMSRKPAQTGQGDQPAANGSSQKVLTLANLLEGYANKADAQLAASGKSAGITAPVVNHIRELRAGVERMRGLAGTSNEKTCAAVLSGFTLDRLKDASRNLSPVQGQDRVAISEQPVDSVATKSLSIGQPYSAAEIEADQVAEAVLGNEPFTISSGGDLPGLQRFLDAEAERQLLNNAPAVVAAAGTAVEGAAVIAAAGGPPGWVIGLAIVAVVAIVAIGGYLYYRSKQPETETQPQPQPKPEPPPELPPELQRERTPLPKPDHDTEEEEEDKKRRCRAMATAQRGGNSCHDQFATMISGTPREWGVETPEGLFADFDGKGVGRILYEVKTGYRFLLNTYPSTRQMRERTIFRFIEQSENQLAIAMRCGYTLLWVFNDPQVAEFVDGFIQPKVISRSFPCDEDR